MSTEDVAETPADFGTLSAPPVAMPVRDDRGFWVAVACAAVLHLALIAGAVRSVPQQHRIMGEADGSKDGISVDIVDASVLLPNSAPAQQQQQPQQQQQQQQEQSQKQQEQQTPPVDASTAPVEPQPRQEQATPAPEKRKPALKAGDLSELLTMPELPGKQGGSTAQPKPRPKAEQQPARPSTQANLQLPQNFNPPQQFMSPQGLSAAVARPSGITRSGENDDFGRGVIRALRMTMPNPNGATGRVTVRLIITETGNLQEVRLLRSGGNATLDQSVVFAVKQSSFPIPPSRSTTDDRTFVVTYIYL
jgi:TonB family protein